MVKIFVEGGGNNNTYLKSQCHKAFKSFFEKAGLDNRLPRVIASGGRTNAYYDFCKSVKNKENAFLLIDSEDIINDRFDIGNNNNQDGSPWEHLNNTRENRLTKPTGVSDKQCHLMVTSMETWLLADVNALSKYFGKNFNTASLPRHNNLERIDKNNVLDAINKAAKDTVKKKYEKGRDSFCILGMIDPALVQEKSPWAKRLIKTLLANTTT
ncbi:MAG: DUF4276 family protein [Mucispirillum sp.]|nr:DUF4276 family protein [Mucispirillum sp.]